MTMQTIANVPTVDSRVVSAPSNPSKQSAVSVMVGGRELIMETDRLAGVYQLSRQQMENAGETVVTPKGEFPVVSLLERIRSTLGMRDATDDDSRALIAIEHNGSISMLKVGSVSRPFDIATDLIHPIPQIAKPTHDEGMIPSIANVKPDSDDSSEALRLVFDPLAVLGLQPIASKSKSNQNGRTGTAAVGATRNRSAGSNRSNAVSGRRGKGQLLAFVPDDISRSDIEHVFCLPLAAIAEVVSTQAVLNTTLNSAVIDGYILWRKLPVPIVKLGAVFGIESDGAIDGGTENESDRRLVITRASGNRLVGFHTKLQMQTMKVPASAPRKLESMVGRPCLGSFKTDFADMVVPDLNRILNNDF